MINTNEWTVRTCDGIVLIDPLGKPVKLPYRKVGELLVHLLRAPERAESKSALGTLLWPGLSHAAQATNLRQATAKLRSLIGPENLFANRHECSIAEQFLCRIELPWLKPIPNWQVGLMVSLDDWASSDPIQFFDAIRENIDVLIDLRSETSSALLRAAARGLPPDHRLQGWKELAFGIVSISDLPAANVRFLAAARVATDSKDVELFSRAAFWLAACQILLGRIDRAAKLADEGLEFVKRKCASKVSLLTSMKATSLLHLGRFAESRELMAEGAQFDQATELEQAWYQSLRAFYLATTGYPNEAIQLVQGITAESGGSIQMLTDLARAEVESAGNPEVVVEELEPRIRAMGLVGQRHFALYGTEILATALARCNYRMEADSKLAEARRERRRIGMEYSPWDLHRLAPARRARSA